jgi:hypothetical protein
VISFLKNLAGRLKLGNQSSGVRRTHRRFSLEALEDRFLPATTPLAVVSGATGVVQSPTAPLSTTTLNVQIIGQGNGNEGVLVNGSLVGGSFDSISDLQVSADGQHFAFIGTNNDPTTGNPTSNAIVDGRNIGTFAQINNLQLSADGQHFAFVGVNNDPTTGNPTSNAIVDGRNVGTFAQINNLQLSADGQHFAFVGTNFDPTTGNGTDTAIVDGRNVGSFGQISQFHVSADGQHFAFVGTSFNSGTGNGTDTAVVNGATVGTFNQISALQLSADGQHFAFVGSTLDSNGNVISSSAIVDGRNLGTFNQISQLQLSPDGQHSAFVGVTSPASQQDTLTVVVGGSSKGTFNNNVLDLQFSSDSQHFAFVGVNVAGNQQFTFSAVVDGATVGTFAQISDLQLSADGQHFAFVETTTDSAGVSTSNVIVDGRNVGTFNQISDLQLTPDGQHFAFVGVNFDPVSRSETDTVIVDGIDKGSFSASGFFSSELVGGVVPILVLSADGQHFAFAETTSEGIGFPLLQGLGVQDESNATVFLDGRQVADVNGLIGDFGPALFFLPDDQLGIASQVDAGVNNGVSEFFEITGTAVAPAPAQLSFTTEPPASVAAGSTFGATVQVTDAFGNPVAGVQVDLAATPGSLTGPLTATTNSQGQAVFSNLAADTAGALALTASVSGLPAVSSTSVTVTPAAASHLSFALQPPASVAAGSPFSAAVQVTDQFGNAVAGATVNLGVSSGSLNGVLTATTNSLGQAIFANLSDNTPGALTLTASAAGLSSVSSNSFTVASVAAKLSFATQPPTTITAGSTFSPVVQVTDALGNTVAGVPVTLALSSGTLNGTLSATTNAQGLAVFSNLSENTAGSFSLKASVSGLTAASSTAFTVTPAAAASLSFTTQPPATVNAGTPFSATVQLTDQFGNAVANSGVSVSIGLATGIGNFSKGTLNGVLTATTNAAGQAIFTNLVEDTAGSFNLKASAVGLNSGSSGGFAVTPAAAAKLAFSTLPPPSVTAGSAFTPVTVQVVDSFGNAVARSGVVVSLAAASGSLNGTLSATTNAQGQAVFSNLSENTAGSFTLKASAAGLTAASSSAVTVTPAAAASLSFTTQPPASLVAAAAFSPVVKVVDQFGNAVAGVSVSLAPSSGTLNGTLTASTNAQGLAVFSGLSEDAAGAFTLKASAAGLTAALSTAFTVKPAAAAKFAFVSQPPATVNAGSPFAATVQLADQFGNAVARSGVTVSAKLTSGLLTGATVTATTNSAGQAVFSKLSENVSGKWMLTVSATGLSSLSSGSFLVRPAAAARIVFATPLPANLTAGATFGTVVDVMDALGNPVAGATVSLGVASGALGGTTMATTNAAGQAFFTNLVESTAGSFVLTASVAGLTSATSGSFIVTPA